MDVYDSQWIVVQTVRLSSVVTGDLEEVERVEDVNPVMTTSFAQSFDLLYGWGPRSLCHGWKIPICFVDFHSFIHLYTINSPFRVGIFNCHLLPVLRIFMWSSLSVDLGITGDVSTDFPRGTC